MGTEAEVYFLTAKRERNLQLGKKLINALVLPFHK